MTKKTTKEVPETQSIVIQFKTFPSFRDKLAAVAKKNRRSTADFVRITMEDLVEREEKNN